MMISKKEGVLKCVEIDLPPSEREGDVKISLHRTMATLKRVGDILYMEKTGDRGLCQIDYILVR